MNRIKKIYLILCLVVSAIKGLSQSLPLNHFGANEGLPSSETYSIFQDSKQRYWICTDNGISLFNGSTFKNFSIKDGLPTNTIFSSFENKTTGKIWFITYGFGLYTFNEESQHFEPHPINPKLIEIFNRGFINSSQFDNHNNLWITYWFLDLLKIDSKNNITFYKPKFNYLSGGFEIMKNSNTLIVRNIYRNHDFEILQNKIFKINNSILIQSNKTHNLGSAKVVEIKNGRLLLAFQKSLFIIDSANVKEEILPSNILFFLFDSKKRLWLSLENKGLWVYKNLNFNEEPIKLTEVGDISISSIIEDSNNKIWCSTLSEGIFCIENLGIENFLLGKKLNKIILNSDYSIIGIGGKLYSKSNVSSKFKELTKKYEIKDIQVGPNRLKFTCNTTYNRVIPQKLDIDNIAANTICFLRDKIIVGNKTNLVIYNYNRKLVMKFDIPSPILKSIVYSPSTILLGCLNGVYLFDGKSFTNLTNFKNSTATRINTFCKNGPDYYVLTEGKGLLTFINGKLQPLKVVNNLSFTSANCMKFVNDSIAWIGTSEGLYKVCILKNRKLKPIYKLTINDGLPSNEINDIEVFNNQLHIATNNGLAVFNLDIKPTNRIAPPYIDLILGNFKDTLFLGYSRTISLSIPKDGRNLYLKFASNRDKSNHINGQISYRLYKNNEMINDWTNIFDNNLQLTNLSSGYYRFEIKIRDLILNEEYLSTAIFFIKPFYYELLWVKILFYSAIGLIILFIIWLIIKKNRYDYEVKRKVVLAEINSLRNQMNPHFIFNALNSIQHFIFSNEQEIASKYLSKFSVLIRKSLEFSKLSYISLREEIKFVEEYLEIEKYRFKNKFQYHILVNDGVDIDNLHVPPLLMQPLVENSIKHGFKELDHDGIIWIKLSIDIPDVLSYSVTDNGPGLGEKTDNNDPYFKTSLSHEILRERFILIKNDYKELESLGIEINNHIFENKYGLEIILKLPVLYD